jgi:E3 ubiquitin-protein ligase UBR4
MDRFLQISLDPASPIPSMRSIISNIKEDPNFAFFKAANLLRCGRPLRAVNGLLAIRDLVDLSPLNPEHASTDELKPSSSFRYLYLLFAIASQKISSDEELEVARNQFVFEKIQAFLTSLDVTVPGAAQFAVGVFCFTARLIETNRATYLGFITAEWFTVMANLLQQRDYPSPVIAIADFACPELFAFLSPLALEYLPPSNLFQDPAVMVHSAILRLLYRVIPAVNPLDIKQFRMLVHPLCVSGLTTDIARKVLTQLFGGDEDAAYQFSDTLQYEKLTADIARQSQETDNFKRSLPHEGLISLSMLFKAILSIAERHPAHWTAFLDSHPDAVKDLFAILSSEYDSNFIVSTASLLRLGQAKFDELSLPVYLYVSTGSASLRTELSQLLLVQPDVVSPYICDSFPAVCRHGSRSQGFFDFLSALFVKVSKPELILSALTTSLKEEFALVQLHPNSHIYHQLASYIEVSGSYLDEQPCAICNNPERRPARMNLDDVRAGSKFTHDTIFTKLKSPLLISSFALGYSVKKRGRLPRVVRLYASTAELDEPANLTGNIPNWRHVSDLSFSRDLTSASVSLPLPLFASCLKFQFVEFWEELSEGGVSKCPQCHNELPKSGLCPRCRENVFACKACRHINYNHLDGFICCECGVSNYVNFEWLITAVSSFSHSRVSCFEDVSASLAKCDELMAKAHAIFANLSSVRGHIDTTLSPATVMPINDRIARLNKLYNEDCCRHSKELTEIVQHVSAIRYAIACYLHLIGGPETEHVNMCYNCRSTYLKNGLAFLAKVAEAPAIAGLDIQSLLISFVDSPTFTAEAVSSLIQFCRVRPELTEKVVVLFKNALPNPSPHIVRLLAEIGRIDDKLSFQRFSAIANAVVVSVKFMNVNGSMTPTVLQPLISSLLSSRLIMRKPETFVQLQVLSSWSQGRPIQKVDPFKILPREVLKALLIECSSSAVRSSIATLLTDAAGLSPGHSRLVYDFIGNLLVDVPRLTPNYEQYLDLLSSLLVNPKRQRAALLGGLFDILFALLDSEVDRIRASERRLVLDLSVGSSAYLLIRSLSTFFSSQVLTRYILTRKRDSVRQLIHIFFKLRSLVIQRSKYLDDSISALRTCVASITAKQFTLDSDGPIVTDNPVGAPFFITIAVEAIKYGHVSVIQELAKIMLPPPPVLNIPILTRKVHTQEDFMPGRVPKDPVGSKSIGTLMRHVKNKICTDLGMPTMMDDDHGMELLVRGNIIELSLPIADVYRHIWLPNEGETPMTVVFRLQGFDGEATEPIIRSFPGAQRADESPDVRFAYTSVLAKDDGFKPLLDALQKDTSIGFVSDAVKCLNAFAAVRANREALARGGGIRLGFHILDGLIAQEVKPDLFEAVVQFIRSLTSEFSETVTNPERHIDFIFNMLGRAIVRQNESLLSPILALVPPLASGSQTLMEKVLKSFLTDLRPADAPDSFNLFERPTSFRVLNGFGEFALALPVNESGNAIRAAILKGPFVADAVSLLGQLFPYTEGQPYSWSAESLDCPALPAVLKTLTGMISSHLPTQQVLLDRNLIPMLLELETQVSQNSIGEFTSNLLEHAAAEPSVCAATIAALKRQRGDAARVQSAIMRELVMKSQSRLSPEIQAFIDDLPEDEGWTCCICKDGYNFYPEDQLGFYVLTRQVQDFFVTQTHFTCIHPRCHMQARNGKPEWEAAAVRNCERPCNGIFPIPSARLPPDAYLQAIARFFDRGNRGLAPWNCVIEVKFHMQKIGEGAMPPGTSVSSAISFIPFLIYAGHVLIDASAQGFGRDPPRLMYEKRIERMVGGGEDTADAWALSLWTLSLEEWRWAKLKLLGHAIKGLDLPGDLDDRALFDKVKVPLIVFALTCKIQGLLKSDSGVAPMVRDGQLQIPSHAGAPWISKFLEDMASPDQMSVWNCWKDCAEEAERTLLTMETIQAVFEYTEDVAAIANSGESAADWIRHQIS